VDRKWNFLLSREFYEPLNQLKIHFEPHEYDDPEMQAEAKKKLSLPIDVILESAESELIPVVKRFEEIKVKAQFHMFYYL
jgi:hypothetical protein